MRIMKKYEINIEKMKKGTSKRWKLTFIEFPWEGGI